jgi:hypothetical protein
VDKSRQQENVPFGSEGGIVMNLDDMLKIGMRISREFTVVWEDTADYIEILG